MMEDLTKVKSTKSNTFPPIIFETDYKILSAQLNEIYDDIKKSAVDKIPNEPPPSIDVLCLKEIDAFIKLAKKMKKPPIEGMGELMIDKQTEKTPGFVQLENSSRPDSPKKDFDSNTKNSLIEKKLDYLESCIQNLFKTNPASEEIMQNIEKLLSKVDDDTKKNEIFFVGEYLVEMYNKLKAIESSKVGTTDDNDKKSHSRSNLTEFCEPNFVSNLVSFH